MSASLLDAVSSAAIGAAESASHLRSTIDLLTPKETAMVRRCSQRTLDRERAEGRGMPYVRLGARIFYRRHDIERYLEAHVRGGERRPVAAAELSRSSQPAAKIKSPAR
jgi:hypothetical protein